MAHERHQKHLSRYLKSHRVSDTITKTPSHGGRSKANDQGRLHCAKSSSVAWSPTSKTVVRTRKLTVDCMPDEILLTLFSYLGPGDLLVCARVCKRWLNLTSDNLMWQRIFKRYAGKAKGQTSSQVKESQPHSQWKSMCIHRLSESRNTKILPLLKKIHPFTGLPAATTQALQKASVRWLLSFEDIEGVNHVMPNSDVFYFSVSVCVRWYSLTVPSVRRLKKIKIYAANPVFFDAKGKAHSNSPCQRSLVYENDFRWSHLSATQSSGGDDTVDVYALGNGLLVATWKDGGDLAFVSISFHGDQLVKRCLLGNSSCPYVPQPHKPFKDDIDSQYGLHGYTCTIELRNQRQSLWTEQFRNLYCREDFLGSGYAGLVLIDPEQPFQRSKVSKKVTLLWRTDALRGNIPNVCFLDLTLLDDRSKPMWCFSNPVRLVQPGNTRVDYDYDGDYFEIVYADTVGRVQMGLTWENEDQWYMMTSLQVHVSLQHINHWFGTHH